MIHELIDPKKKTNKPTASRPIRTLLDNRPFSDQLTLDPSDSENKEVDSSVTFIPPWLRNSLGLSQRHKQSHLSSEQKTAKAISRFKETNQNDFEVLKTNEDEGVCKNVQNQYETTPTHCSPDENLLQNTTQGHTDNVLHRNERLHWQLMAKESDSDSSFPNTEIRRLGKEEPKMTNSDILTLAEIGKIREEEKKKVKYMRQKSRGRRRGCDQKTFESNKTEVESIVDMKRKSSVENCPKKNVRTVPSDVRGFETKFLLLQKCHSGKSPRLTQPELRLLQDMKEHVGSIGDFDVLLEQEKKMNMMKASDFWTNNVGDKKIDDLPTRKYYEDIKPDADRDSLFSTDDENDIKRFSEFLSKNKNAEEKRKCLEEVRNYFERKRKSRMSRRRYLEDLKTKIPQEMEKKDEHKDRVKCRELTMILPNREKRSKFALCDEEVVERAVDETLQKFVELYHFHVSPRVIGNMKKNILQALQSDSGDSSGSKGNLDQKKSSGIKMRNAALTTKQSPKRDVSYSHPRHSAIIEAPSNDMTAVKEPKKKSFKTLIVSSNEQIPNQPKDVDVIENERLKYLNKEIEIFFRSIQNHLDVTSLKIQSIILEKEETNPSKNVQFVYNVSKKELAKSGQENNFHETQEMKTFKEAGVQTNLRKELTKKRVRIQAVEMPDALEQGLQTDEKTLATQSTQTENDHLTFRELKELESFQINAGLYRMVKSKEEGKFYLYPEQKETSSQHSDTNDVTVSKDKKIKKKELLSKERVICLREKDRGRSKKNKKVYYTGSHPKATASRKEKETKRKQLGIKCKNQMKQAGSIDCLYFRNDEENASEPMSVKEPQTEMESVADATEKLGMGEAKEEHLGCVWLWNGEKISPGCDLKTHVENLLKEKLKEMTGIDSHSKNLLMRDLNIKKSEGGTLQPNLLVAVSSRPKLDSEVLPEMEESQKNFGVKKSNPVFCYTSYSNLNTEKSSRVQFTSENDTAEPKGNSHVKRTEETKALKSSQLSLIQDKSVRSVATQNSQPRILPLKLTKSGTHSKTTVSLGRKKENKRTQSTKLTPSKMNQIKKAERIIRAVEEIKELQIELGSGTKDYSRDSDSPLDDRSSSYGSKNEIDDPLSMILGFREESQRADETSSCTVKSRLRKVMDFVNHEAQAKTVAGMNDTNSEESGDVVPPGGNQRHLQLIENFLCKVNHKERENLWNDVRKFIKTKIGRDINDEGAREVCIEIEQDMPRSVHGTMKQVVLAKGHYVRNEGDVEVEIDLTLDDLEKILRQRQKKIRKQRLHRRKYKRFISSSSVQSDLNKEEIRKYQKYLNKVAGLRENCLTASPSVLLKKNKGN